LETEGRIAVAARGIYRTAAGAFKRVGADFFHPRLAMGDFGD